MKLRNCAGGILESKQSTVEVKTWEEFFKALAELVSPRILTDADNLHTELYLSIPDTRTGWATTYVLVHRGHGVLAYCDSSMKTLT